MAFTSKPKRVEAETPKGRSLVYYLGAHPFKGIGLPGTADYMRDAEGKVQYVDYVADGMTVYDFDRVDPKAGKRYAIVDLPQHLYFFALWRNAEGVREYEVKATAKHKQALETIQRAFIIDLSTGYLKARQEAAQLEADLGAILGS